jgi:hypothetical protein
MNWFNILKESRQITDIGFDFDLPEEEESEIDEDKCCEHAKGWFEIWRKEYKIPLNKIVPSKGMSLNDMDCDELREWIGVWSINFWFPSTGDGTNKGTFARYWLNDILREWKYCESGEREYDERGHRKYSPSDLSITY